MRVWGGVPGATHGLGARSSVVEALQRKLCSGDFAAGALQRKLCSGSSAAEALQRKLCSGGSAAEGSQ